MRIAKCILFSISICIFLCLTVSAHPGRTDSNGGHTDNSTGDYHYHHGYPAHDHYDMDGDGDADCPYNFDDKTGQSSGNSSSVSEHSSNNSYKAQRKGALSGMLEKMFLIIFAIVLGGPLFFVVYGIAFFLFKELCLLFLRLTSLPENKKDKYSTHVANLIVLTALYIIFLPNVVQWLSNSEAWLASILVIVGIALYAGMLYCINKGKSENALHGERNSALSELKALKEENVRLSAENDQLRRRNNAQATSICQIQNQCECLRQENTALQNDLLRFHQTNSSETSVLIDLPNNIYFVNGNVPVKGKVTDRKPYGDFTVYLAQKGHCYHSDCSCGSGYLRAVHIFEVYGKKTPCQKCGKALPDGIPKWYTENRHRLSLR